MHPYRRFWRALLELPHLPIALYLGLIGVAGLATHTGIVPRTMQGVLPYWMVTLWTASIGVGGILATVGAITLRTRIESVGLIALSWGALLYGSVIVSTVWPHGVTTAAVSAAILSMCLLRMKALSVSRTAQRTAATILRDRES